MPKIPVARVTPPQKSRGEEVSFLVSESREERCLKVRESRYYFRRRGERKRSRKKGNGSRASFTSIV